MINNDFRYTKNCKKVYGRVLNWDHSSSYLFLQAVKDWNSFESSSNPAKIDWSIKCSIDTTIQAIWVIPEEDIAFEKHSLLLPRASDLFNDIPNRKIQKEFWIS